MKQTASKEVTGPKTLYLDTGPVRHLWKLHSNDWKNLSNPSRIAAESLRGSLIDLKKDGKLEAVTSVFAVMEMQEFARTHRYVRNRFDEGDDVLDYFDNRQKKRELWKAYPGGPSALFQQVQKDFQDWLSGDGSEVLSQIYDFDSTLFSSRMDLETSSTMKFAAYLSFLTATSASDSVHLAYALATSNGILTSDGELASIVNSQVSDSWSTVADVYEICFRQKLGISKKSFKAFRYAKTPTDKIAEWASSD